MAQFTPKFRWFEDQWRERNNLAVKVLRDFEDLSLRSDFAPPSRTVIAVVLNVFAFDFHDAGFIGYQGIPVNELWSRTLDEWACAVGSAETECARLCPNRKDWEYSELVESLYTILVHAVKSWECKPDRPSCEELVQAMIDELMTRGFVAISYG